MGHRKRKWKQHSKWCLNTWPATVTPPNSFTSSSWHNKCDSYLLSGCFPWGWYRWRCCILLCPPAGHGGASAHLEEVHIEDPGHSSGCRPHTPLQCSTMWHLNTQSAESVWALYHRWGIPWTVWSAASCVTDPAAGAAAPGCLDTEASHTENPVTYWILKQILWDPPTAVCLCVKRWIRIPWSQAIMRLTVSAGCSF